jgi:hypothetical protein
VFLVISRRIFQSLLDQIHVWLGGLDAGGRLLLERVEDVQRLSNRTMYTAQYAFPSCDSTISSTPELSPFQRLRRRRSSAELSNTESVPHVVFYHR